MDGLFFLLSVVAVALVKGWAARNDRAAPDQPTGGLFAMTDRDRVAPPVGTPLP